MNVPKILIIDDSAAMCYFISTALQKLGFQVTIALDGHSGLSKLAAQRPDCLILDIVLPDINGYTICRQIRAIDPKHTLPIVLTSTKSTALDRSYGMKLGADRYLPKPFTEEDLMEAVWAVLPPQARFAATPASIPTPRHAQTGKYAQVSKDPLENLVPRKRKDHLLFVASNPITGTVYMEPPMHQLYTAIDGRKTAKALSKLTALNEQDVSSILQKLFEQKRIDFFDREGHVLAISPFK